MAKFRDAAQLEFGGLDTSSAGNTESVYNRSMSTVAFIGTGVMGSSMAAHLMAAGYSLVVHNRSKDKAAALLAKGAAWAESAGEAVADADIVVTMLGMPADVENIYTAPGGLLDRAKPGTLLIDMTTSSPLLAIRLAKLGKARGLRVLDAPVSGGDVGAREAKLSIMVGAEPADFEAARQLFECMGKNIVLQGPPGSGQYCKMCNQIAIAGTMVGMTESFMFCLRAGLDPRTVLASIGSGAAGSWSLANLLPRMIDGNPRPGFFIKHFKKDMGIALESARELGLKLPGLELTQRLYTALAALGPRELEAAADLACRVAAPGALEKAEIPHTIDSGADLGTQALYLLYAAGRL